jgi:cysteine synthase
VLALLRWLGAACHRVPSSAAQATITALRDREQAYVLDQFADSKLCDYYEPVADEILAQRPDVDAIVVGIGTGGSITGIARRVRGRGARCRIIGVEPAEAQVSRGAPWAPHDISGLAPPMARNLLDPGLIDGVEAVPSAVAWRTARRLARENGLLVGPSAGATVAAAARIRERGARRVVAILGGTLTEHLTAERLERYATFDEEAGA